MTPWRALTSLAIFRLSRFSSGGLAAFALAFAMLAATPSAADVVRPMDERATARLIAEEVARQAPEAEVKLSFGTLPPGVSLIRGGAGIWLDAKDIHSQLRDAKNGDAREAALQEFVADKLALAAHKKADAGKRKFDTTQIVPFIRSPEYGGAGPADIRRAPFIGDMYQCWMLIEARGFSCLATWELPRTGLGRLEIMRLGLQNLEARIGEVTETIEGPVHRLRLDPRFGSSLMLLERYWTERAAEGSVTVAIPVEGELWWTLNADAATLVALRQEVRNRFGEAERGEVTKISWGDGSRVWMAGLRPLSLDLYRWTDAGWAVLPE